MTGGMAFAVGLGRSITVKMISCRPTIIIISLLLGMKQTIWSTRENVLDFNLLCKQCALYIVSHFVAVNLNTVCSPRFVCDLFIMMPYNQPYCCVCDIGSRYCRKAFSTCTKGWTINFN